MTSGLKHIFIGLLAILTSSFLSYLIILFEYFSLGLFVFYLSLSSSFLYIIDVNSLSVLFCILFSNLFSKWRATSAGIFKSILKLNFDIQQKSVQITSGELNELLHYEHHPGYEKHSRGLTHASSQKVANHLQHKDG